MAVSRDDVRHIAVLARVGLGDDRLDVMVEELNGILRHMEVLTQFSAAGAASAADDEGRAMPLAADEPPAVPLERPREAFGPLMRDGFFLVPRLATHEDPEES